MLSIFFFFLKKKKQNIDNVNLFIQSYVLISEDEPQNPIGRCDFKLTLRLDFPIKMFTVNINFFNIEDHLVEVSTTTTNYDLKLLLSEMTATDPKSFNLIFEGNILNDNIQLIEQGIVPDCFVDVELTRQAGALHRLKIALGDENLVTETHFNSILADTSDVTLVTDFLLSGVVTDQRLLITGLVRGRRNLNILILETLLKHIPADVRRITVALAIPIRCDIKVIEMLLKYDVPFGCIQNLSESDADLISLLFQYGWKLPVSHYLPIAQQFIKSFPVRYLDFKSPTVSGMCWFLINILFFVNK